MNSDANMPCTDCVTRRTFLTQSAMMAAVAALAACGAASDATAPNLTSTVTVKLSDQPALANIGGVALVTLGGSPFAIVRIGTASFVTVSRVCPHQGSIVNKSGNGFLCPNHGAQFSTVGTWTGGQQTSNLRSYPTSYDASTDLITIG